MEEKMIKAEDVYKEVSKINIEVNGYTLNALVFIFNNRIKEAFRDKNEKLNFVAQATADVQKSFRKVLEDSGYSFEVLQNHFSEILSITYSIELHNLKNFSCRLNELVKSFKYLNKEVMDNKDVVFNLTVVDKPELISKFKDKLNELKIVYEDSYPRAIGDNIEVHFEIETKRLW